MEIWKGYPMVGKSLGADFGYDIGSSNSRSYGGVYFKLEGYPLGCISLGADGGSEIGSSNGKSYGDGDVKIDALD